MKPGNHWGVALQLHFEVAKCAKNIYFFFIQLSPSCKLCQCREGGETVHLSIRDPKVNLVLEIRNFLCCLEFGHFSSLGRCIRFTESAKIVHKIFQIQQPRCIFRIRKQLHLLLPLSNSTWSSKMWSRSLLSESHRTAVWRRSVSSRFPYPGTEGQTDTILRESL